MKFEIDYRNQSVVLYDEDKDDENTKELVKRLNDIIQDKQVTIQVKMLILDDVYQQIKSGKPINEIQYLDNVYLVGGAVRDLMLHDINPHKYSNSIRDKDYVITNYSEEKITLFGFKKVGAENSFKVFLDDKGTEFVLATDGLEADLKRRDLTINSIAARCEINSDMTSKLESQHQALNENKISAKECHRLGIIDPFNGVQDLLNAELKHTSQAFRDDHIRILRICRFAQKYHFTINDQTKMLIKDMLEEGKLKTTAGERIFLEIEKALDDNNGIRYHKNMFEHLHEIGALSYVLPEIENLFGVPQSPEHHPEIDSGIHTMMVLREAAKMKLSNEAKFAALLHDVGKGLTEKSQLPRHIGHEVAGVPLVENICNRLRIPKKYLLLAHAVCEKHLNVHRAEELSDKTILKLFEDKRLKNNFEEFVLVCKADKLGRLGLNNKPYPQAQHLINVHKAYQSELKGNLKEKIAETAIMLTEQQAKPDTIKNSVHQLKLNAVKKINKQIKINVYQNKQSSQQQI